MLELSPAEKQHLGNATTVAMNKYMLFWEKLGIWPSHYFLSDDHAPTEEVLRESLKIIFNSGRPWPRLLINRTYRALVPLQMHAHYFERALARKDAAGWATSLEEPMYFFRGSLTVLLNYLTVQKAASRVCLLGVDLSRPGHFFSEELTRDYPHLVDRRAINLPAHFTALPRESWPPIQKRLPYAVAQARKHGVEVVSGAKDSLLVTQGICDYQPILPPEQA
jgi:hypothetical protein